MSYTTHAGVRHEAGNKASDGPSPILSRPVGLVRSLYSVLLLFEFGTVSLMGTYDRYQYQLNNFLNK